MSIESSACLSAVRRHVERKGYREAEGVNNFVPHDAVAAFGMAARLIAEHPHDTYLAVAPEGHIYGFFFEHHGVRVDECWVDYPPTHCRIDVPAERITGKRVLLIEDDVMSGRTLRLVVAALQPLAPASLDLYLGHSSGVQITRNVPKEISRVFVTDEMANERNYAEWYEQFVKVWGKP